MSLQNSFKQASAKASRFDVIDQFYRGILQRSNNHISTATRHSQKIFTSLKHLHLL